MATSSLSDTTSDGQELMATRQELMATRQELMATRQELMASRQRVAQLEDTLAEKDIELVEAKRQCHRFQTTANLNNRALVATKYTLERVESMYKTSASAVADVVQNMGLRAIVGVNRELRAMIVKQTAVAAEAERLISGDEVVIHSSADDMTRDPNKYQCPECPKQYKGLKCLHKHMTRKHPTATPMDTTGATTDNAIAEFSISDDD